MDMKARVPAGFSAKIMPMARESPPECSAFPIYGRRRRGAAPRRANVRIALAAFVVYKRNDGLFAPMALDRP